MHGLKMVTVAELIRYRLQHERYIHRVAEALMPTAYGEFRMIAYESEVEGGGVACGAGVWRRERADEPVLVRVHTHCLAGDVFGATLCDCRAVVEESLRMIAEAGRGALVYLHNGARGFGIDRDGAAGPGGALHREQRTRERGRRTASAADAAAGGAGRADPVGPGDPARSGC